MSLNPENMSVDELIGYAKGLEYALECMGKKLNDFPVPAQEKKLPTITVIETQWGTVQLTKETAQFLEDRKWNELLIKSAIHHANLLAQDAHNKGADVPLMDWPKGLV